MKLRRHTQDEMAYREVLIENEYGLPDALSPRDQVVDIGAHIGCFAIACLNRGVGFVECYEPCPDNFAVLNENLTPFVGRAAAFQAAVWKEGGQKVRLFYPGDSTHTAMPQANERRGTILVRTF